MFVEDRLLTSDATHLRLYDLTTSPPSLLAEVVQPGQVCVFGEDPAGEAIAVRDGLVARSFTPLETRSWTEAPSHVGLYMASDLSLIRHLELPVRLDHQSLALGPDARSIVSVFRGAGGIAFDAETGDEQWRLPGEIGSGTSVSPEGRWVAMGETGQGGGFFTLIDTQAAGGPDKIQLDPPSSRAPLYDSPFESMFTADGRFVLFTSSAWGRSGLACYPVDPDQTAEHWSRIIDSPPDDEESEFWDAPWLQLALGDTLALAGDAGFILAVRIDSGDALDPLVYDAADDFRFAADSKRRCVWVTRHKAPAPVPFPDDW